MDEPFSLPALLKSEREARNLDAEELSRSLGLHAHVIKAWEAGKQRPRFTSAVRWAAALGYTVKLEPVAIVAPQRGTLTLKNARAR